MKKFLLSLLAFCLLLSAVACTADSADTAQSSDTEEKSEAVTTSDGSEEPPRDTDPEAIKRIYDGIITDYKTLLTAKKNGEELPVLTSKTMDKRERAIAEALYGIVDACKDAETAQNMGYGYKDMDGNGCPELILLTQYATVRAIFTVSDKKPLLLEAAYGENGHCLFATNNRFFISRETLNGNIQEGTTYTCRVQGNKMVYDSIYGTTFDTEKKEVIENFQIKNGVRTPIDKETYGELNREYYQTYSNPSYNNTVKLLAPRIYFPLKDKTPDEGLPVADFSSYAAIRDTYIAIATCLDKFRENQWVSGAYDNLFSFPDDTAYDYYNRLLYLSSWTGANIGYDEIDLNGDGQDELVLLRENYAIKAIFTQKNGIPVLVDSFPTAYAWLDDKGQIHVDREEYYELEYSLYDFTENGDFHLVYSILVAENGNRYLTKNGKTEKISFEESLEIYYDDYCRYTEPFDPNEHTRSVSSLTYTPLSAPEEDPLKGALAQTWHKYASLDKTSGREWGAWSNTYITFENATESQMDVNLKYVFTFSYPDPDRENYLLDDSTESYLKATVTKTDGIWRFEGDGIKGRFEFGTHYLWMILEESSDERFPVGAHGFDVYEPME
ncbi:MAG: hypothetical protein IJW90_04770 [Clostridia bacterium]|nr:hypothetical protein [Clostridia bacterium]